MRYKIYEAGKCIYEGDHGAVFLSHTLQNTAPIAFIQASPDLVQVHTHGSIPELTVEEDNDLWIGRPGYTKHIHQKLTVVYSSKGGEKCSSLVTKRRASKSTSASRKT